MRPDVFVVWAHTSPGWDDARKAAWRDTVHRFTLLLHELGADADADLYYEHKGVDWSTLCLKRMEEADRIVVAVSAGWKLAFPGYHRQSPGAEYECAYLRGLLMEHRDVFERKVILAVLPGATKVDIPLSLACMQRYEVDPAVPETALGLKHRLLEQPKYVKPSAPVPRLRELARAGAPEVVAELLNTTVYLPDPDRPGLVATEVDGHEQSVLVFTGVDRLAAYRKLKNLSWDDRWLEVGGAELLPLVAPLRVGVVIDAGAPEDETVFVSAAEIQVLLG